MKKKLAREDYVVVTPYRTQGRWLVQGDEIQLSEVASQGLLPQGKIAKPEDAEKAITAANKVAKGIEEKAEAEKEAEAKKAQASKKTPGINESTQGGKSS